MKKLLTFFNLFLFFLPVQFLGQENNTPDIQLDQIIHVICPNTSTGSITISVTGNTSEISYSWAGPENYSSIDQDISGLAAGTYTVSIANKSSSTVYDEATFVVERNDAIAPTVSAPAAKNINTDNGTCVATNIDLGTPTVSDNCEQVEITNNAPDSFPIGETTVVWTVTDAAGNTASDTQIITVEDNENPIITAPAAKISNTDTGKCSATGVALGTPTVSDNCSGTEYTNNAPDSFPIGETIVTWTVTDAAENTATATQIITVEDNEYPEITAPAPKTITTDTGGCAATNISLGTPTTSDNCSEETYTNNAPDSFPIGETNVTWTVTDAAGNTATDTQIITVEDKEAPVPPALEELSWSCGKIVPTPVATDNCAGQINGTSSDPLEFSTPGEYTINWAFEDSYGNKSTVEQTVSIPNPTVNNPAENDPEKFSFCNAEEVPAISLKGSTVSGTTYRWENSNPSIGLAASGTGTIPSFTASNTSNVTATAEILITPVANGCEGTPESFTIKVYPTATVEKPQDITVCAGEEIKIPGFSGGVTGTTFSWTNDNPAIGLTASGSGNISVFKAKNPTPEPIQANIHITPSANACPGTPVNFEITVNPQPVLSTTLEDQVYCNGMPTTAIPLESLTSGVVYDINGGESIGLSDQKGITAIPAFTPVNNGDEPKTIPVSITPRANGCTGATIEYNITVNPTANISVSALNSSICSGGTTDISLSSTTESSFRWTVSEITGEIKELTKGAEGSGAEIIQTLTNTSNNAPAEVKFRVVPIANGCEGAPIFVSVEVYPTATMEKPENLVVCDNNEVPEISFSGSKVDGTTYRWENNRPEIGLPESGTGNIDLFTAVNTSGAPVTATIKVFPVANGCEGTPETFEITVNPTPELTSPLQAPGFCSETAFMYEFSSNVPGTEFSWSRKAVNGISTPANSDSGNINEVLVNTTTNPIEIVYEVTLVSPNGCINTTKVTTTVTPTPILTSTLTPPAVCSGTDFQYSPTSRTGGSVFSWSRAAVDGISNPAASGTGSINEVLENTTNQTLGVTYKYTLSSNNCENPQVYNVTVNVTPSPDTEVSVSKNDEAPVMDEIEICPGQTVDLFSTTSFPNESNLPAELLHANFNNGSQGWSTPTNDSQRWRLTGDGEEAYRNECEWWEEYFYDCEDEIVAFHSNTNDQFLSVNSSEDYGDFENVNLVSPILNTQNYNTLELSFWHHYRDGGASRYNEGDIGFLESRTRRSDGTWRRWQEIDTYTSTEGEADAFVQRTYPVDHLIGHEAVQIRFRYDNAEQDYYWAIDNINITGNGAAAPEVHWTADTSDWTSEEENPENITPIVTTVYTATYTDPETNCPGSASVKVIVKDPPKPQIIADYCAYEEANRISLSADKDYDRYEWSAAGEIISDEKSIDVNLAQAYTLRVWENGCEGSTSLTASENLVENGNFEDGNTGFNTIYNFVPPGGDLYPEGDYAVDDNANDYHNDFYGLGHGGDGNFMIVNGDPSQGNVVWESNVIEINPETDYYFSAWTMNLVGREEARLRLIITIPGQSGSAAESTLGDLTDVPVGEWIQFYNPQVWNSGANTEVVLKIINENSVRNGNDFGIDDISFAALDPIEYSIAPPENITLCPGEPLIINANISGGKDPVFTWTGPDGEIIENNPENPGALEIENVTPENAGTYHLSVLDFYGCEPKTAEIEVEIPDIVLEQDFAVCAESASVDGISLKASILGLTSTEASGTWTGGTGTINQAENPLSAVYTPTKAELTSASTLDFLFTSGSGCTEEISISINPTPKIALETTSVSCFGGSDGTATVTVTGGGTAPFSYSWNDENNQTTATATGLKAGTYTVTITDAMGCSVISETVEILAPTALNIVETGFSEPGCGENSNTAFIKLSGGFIEGLTTPEYSVNLYDGDENPVDSSNISATTEEGITTYTARNLSSGNYTFNVSSGTGCSATAVALTIPFAPCNNLDFDGVDDYVDLGNKYALNSTFSLGAWVKPHTVSGIQTIISKRNFPNLAEGGYDLILNNGRPAIQINDEVITTNRALSTSRWFHISATFDGNEVKLYVDGVLLESATTSKQPKQISAPVLIGAMYDPDAPQIPKHHFNGWIQEVRIWNKALTVGQIQFMMNQKITKNGTAVKGEILPMNVPDNLVWSDLLGYYPLLVNEVANGITEDKAENKVAGQLKNMETSQENTAPLPYILYTTTNGNWYERETWLLPEQLNGENLSQRDVWEPPNSVGIDNKTRIDWNIVKLENDVKNPETANNKNSIKLLGLISEAGTFNMMGTNNMTGNALIITAYLKLHGFIDLNGESQLIQSEGSVLEETSSGYIQRDQQGTKNSYNYNYWSSPVSTRGTANNSGFSIATVLRDGSNPQTAQEISFGTPYSFADGNYAGNLRISSYWLNIYHGSANTYGAWHPVSPETHLDAGTGYTMKGTSGTAPIKEDQNYIFTGKPNNGDITLTISDYENRLIGNPYPSALDMTAFIKDNLRDVPEGRNSKNVFNGAIYFWDHFGPKNSHYLADYVGGYAVFNLSGGVPGVATDKRINANGKSGTKIPGKWMPVGQGFFVNTVIDEALAESHTIHGGAITFKNNQRGYKRENPGNSIFLKPEQENSEEAGVVTEDPRPKIRLNFRSPSGYYRQLLLTVDGITSNGFDLAYDAPMIDNVAEDLYWLIKDEKFVIQGVSNIEQDQVLPLGMKIAQEGEIKIKIESLKNISETVEIFLRDNKDSTYHNLIKKDFITDIQPGTFAERFEVVFSDGTEVENKRPQILLNFESGNGYTQEILAVAHPETTIGYDKNIDKPLDKNNHEELYWYFGDTRFLKQGVPDFNKNRELQLGLEIHSNQEFSIGIKELQNIPDDMDIFLRDTLIGLFHDLKETNFKLSLEPGTYNSRFSIVFQKKTEEPEKEELLEEKIEIIYAHSSREIIISNPGLKQISQLYLYNSLGQLIKVYKELTVQKEVVLPVGQFAAGIYITKLTGENTAVSKKIILK